MSALKQSQEFETNQPMQQTLNHTDFLKSLLDKVCSKIGAENVAYITITFATTVFSLGFLYPNQHNFDVCQTFLIRSIALLSINFTIAKCYNMDTSFKDPYNFRILLIRNVFAGIQNIMFTVSQFYLTQPIVQTLNTSAIIFIFVQDYFINSVTITRKQFYGVILGIIGVLLTVNGDFIITKFNPDFQRQSDFENYATDDPMIKLTVALLFIASNVLWAYSQVITKQLKGVNSIQLNLHIGIVYLFGTGLFYPSMVEKQVEFSTFVVGIFAGGFVSAIGQIAFIGAIKMTKNTGVLTTFSFNSVIVGYLVSVFKYNEAINPICIIGAGFILVGLLRIVLKDKTEQVASIKQ